MHGRWSGKGAEKTVGWRLWPAAHLSATFSASANTSFSSVSADSESSVSGEVRTNSVKDVGTAPCSQWRQCWKLR